MFIVLVAAMIGLEGSRLKDNEECIK